jgi:hypothetical protein
MKPNSRELDHTRGVSEVVGFILILGIMMAGIAIITLYGYPLLVKEEANSNIRNMEKNMIVLQNDVNNLAYKSVPYKETMIQIGDGTFLVKPSSSDTKSFTISNSSTDLITFKPGELQFKASPENVIVGLQNGAVLVSYWSQGGSAMISEPRWFEDGNTFVISLINITADNDLAKSGIANVQLQLINSSTTTYTTVDIVKVNYSEGVDFDYPKAWENYLVNTLMMAKSGNVYTKSGVNNITIKTYEIKVAGI